LAGDALIVLYAPVAIKIGHSLLAKGSVVEIPISDNNFVVLGLRLGQDLTIRVHDDAACNHRMAVFHAALCQLGEHDEIESAY
jgi:hypothetical protein